MNRRGFITAIAGAAAGAVAAPLLAAGGARPPRFPRIATAAPDDEPNPQPVTFTSATTNDAGVTVYRVGNFQFILDFP